MGERYDVTVVVCELERGDKDWAPDRLVDVISWFNGKLSEVPEQYRADTVCEIDSSYGGYEGSDSATIRISYNRPETDGEMEQRLSVAAAREIAHEENIRAREIAVLRALQAKYPDAT